MDDTRALKASFNGTTTTLQASRPLGVDSGFVVFGDGETVSLFKASTGTTRGIIDSDPTTYFVNNGMFYFVEGAGTDGTGGSVYRVTLN